MAQVKLLKIDADGVPVEFDSVNDDITLKSFAITGGGPVLSASGLDMNNTDIIDVQDLAFVDPTTGTINQTAGALIIDNLMAKERDNVMTTAGAILFPAVTNTGAQVDSFRIPRISGAPSATPSFSADAGYMVYDYTNGNLYIWDGTSWDNLSTVTSAENLDNNYTADVNVAVRDVVYISNANSVSPAKADASTTDKAIGFALATITATNPVSVRKNGTLSGFSGLTVGARYYLSAATAGAVTSTIPTGSGNSIIQVGYAKASTIMDIQFLILGRRAA